MKLKDEHLKSYVNDIKDIGLLRFLTYQGFDIAPAWVGAYEPATTSDDSELASLARFSRDHYMFYRALVERYMEKKGKVLDVGCGSGQRTAMLSRYSESILAIDSDPSKISVGAMINHMPNIEWLYDEFLSWSEKNEDMFDYIFAIEIIEHIQLEVHTLFIDRLLNKLNSGGILFITTPKDKHIKRKAPHIGLWDPLTAKQLAKDLNLLMKYFNVNQIQDGGEDPWSTEELATHYVAIGRK